MKSSTFPTALQKLILGYLGLAIVGCAMLNIPGFQDQTATPIDHIFTAISALTTTGLVTIDTGPSYTLAGEVVIMLLIQVGGIGFMSLAGILLLESNYGLKEPEEDDEEEMVNADYTLPDRADLRGFIRKILYYTACCELIGGSLLAIHFSRLGLDEPIWNGFFIAVSAFCTAGLYLFAEGLGQFSDDTFFNVTVSALCLAGSFGFLFFSDVVDRLTGHKEKFSLTTYIIVVVMSISVLLLWGVFCTKGAIGPKGADTTYEATLIALFTAISTVSTTGFSTTTIASFPAGSISLIVLFMFIGASPSGTGGGIKNTTLATAIAVLISVVRRHADTVLFNRKLSQYRIHLAIGLGIASVLTVTLASITLLINQPELGLSGVFEVFSALGTVGLSLGATAKLNTLSLVLVMGLMFVGRIGVLSVLMAAIGKSPNTKETEGDGDADRQGKEDDEVAIEG